MQNKDRKGKWQPFDALEGYKQALNAIEYEKGKISKPLHLSDMLEELDLKLTNAITNKKPIKIKYFKNGYIYDLEGVISKVDLINKEIFLDSTRIKINTIQAIEEIE